ncbi:hypothetical protein BZG36_04651 [Bifiguratus adelaidae]|uniref:BHLH domain-containing protein n=1 Tax=Bifiguratus adelaidae TaxID=1938954 RepID=A0A261Y0D3_9FUNG|nr:hypothetical protein BZG36_04651 [Bifiguratus adelaidae]
MEITKKRKTETKQESIVLPTMTPPFTPTTAASPGQGAKPQGSLPPYQLPPPIVQADNGPSKANVTHSSSGEKAQPVYVMPPPLHPLTSAPQYASISPAYPAIYPSPTLPPGHHYAILPHQNGQAFPIRSASMSSDVSVTSGTTADQREHMRKVSHSAIERRRREKMNDKITQLKQLIPGCIEQEHLHKLDVLQYAIEYIKYLQGAVLDSKSKAALPTATEAQGGSFDSPPVRQFPKDMLTPETFKLQSSEIKTANPLRSVSISPIPKPVSDQSLSEGENVYSSDHPVTTAAATALQSLAESASQQDRQPPKDTSTPLRGIKPRDVMSLQGDISSS